MERKRVLVVDDEPRMRKLVRDFLTRSQYEVVEAEDGEQAVDLFFAEDSKFDLILLDVMMPKMNGWEVVKTIRKFSDIPIIMMTAKGEEADELQGFSLGADDYVAKPFSPRLLVARVDARLRRNVEADPGIQQIGAIGIDKAAHSVSVDGKELELSIKEFELLCYFADNPGIALSRETILNRVWNYDYFGDARTIDTHVKKLRSKLGDYGSYIQTVWGYGYKFQVEKDQK